MSDQRTVGEVAIDAMNEGWHGGEPFAYQILAALGLNPSTPLANVVVRDPHTDAIVQAAKALVDVWRALTSGERIQTRSIDATLALVAAVDAAREAQR